MKKHISEMTAEEKAAFLAATRVALEKEQGGS